jgi:CHRD domain-containing protein/LVIVD repeat-containing protein
MRSKSLVAFLVVVVGAMLLQGVAVAGPDSGGRNRLRSQAVDSPLEVDELQDHQHGGEGGHLPGSSENVELVGQADIEGAAPDRVADVSAFGNYAYLTVRDPEGCSDAGVAIFDISDPTNPTQVGFIEATEGSFPGEGSDILDMNTPAFTGQVLIFNNEICAEGGEGGFSLWDVTDPLNPVVLTAHAGDDDPGGFVSQFNQIHSAFGWQADDRAFVVIVDNEETTDVDIFEITDPLAPVFIAELDLNEFGVLQEEGTPLGEASFLHDMTVQRVRGTWTMLLSYWDGGWVLLDVDDPANPVFIADSDYPTVDPLTGLSPVEGNAHQAEFSPNGRFIIGTDEDFSPHRVEKLEITTGPNAGAFEAVAVGGGATPALLEDGLLNGPVVYGGYGCPPDLYPGATPVPQRSDFDLDLAPGEEAILVLQRGPVDDPSEPIDACFPGEKANEAIEAGWDAVVLVNHHAGDPTGEVAFCGSGVFPPEPPIVTVCTTHTAFHLMFNTEPAFDLPYDPAKEPQIGDIGERVSATAIFDGWGYVRLLDRRSLEEIDAYAIEEALDPAFAFGFGDLSVHEVAVDPFKRGLAYLAYYAGGLRVIRYGPNGIEEVGHYIDEDGNDFWGVEVHRLPGSNETLILASDRDSGLWIFRFTGDDRGGRSVLSTTLTGAEEVPGPGDPDGTGRATIRLNSRTRKVCFRLSWSNIAPPTASHIHEAPAGEAGDIVVTLFSSESPLPDTITGVSGCASDVSSDLIEDIIENPEEYYVNVHNADFPAGAIRGQLDDSH